MNQTKRKTSGRRAENKTVLGHVRTVSTIGLQQNTARGLHWCGCITTGCWREDKIWTHSLWRLITSQDGAQWFVANLFHLFTVALYNSGKLSKQKEVFFFSSVSTLVSISAVQRGAQWKSCYLANKGLSGGENESVSPEEPREQLCEIWNTISVWLWRVSLLHGAKFNQIGCEISSEIWCDCRIIALT